jgi:5,10-methylenetetrahydrofolate reductase
VEVCTELSSKLLAHGVPGIHYYALNRSASVTEIMTNLGLARVG